jgi:hypothetical protein
VPVCKNAREIGRKPPANCDSTCGAATIIYISPASLTEPTRASHQGFLFAVADKNRQLKMEVTADDFNGSSQKSVHSNNKFLLA